MFGSGTEFASPRTPSAPGTTALPRLTAATGLVLAASGLGTAPAAGLSAGPALETSVIVEAVPKTMPATTFTAEDAAVTITVDGLDPGAEARLQVISQPEGVVVFRAIDHADSLGAASFSVAGSPGRRPNSYAGGYSAEVTLSSGAGPLSTPFSITPVSPGLDVPVADSKQPTTSLQHRTEGFP